MSGSTMFRQGAFRVIAVEYIQNLPILIGLGYAIVAPDWGWRFLAGAIGAVVTAVVIGQTEARKLGQTTQHRERPADVVANALFFFAGTMIYIIYYVLIRESSLNPTLVDLLIGCVLGGSIGLLQGFFVSERRLSISAMAHAVALALTAALLLVSIGVLSGSTPPLLMAFLLCIPMTLIIVRFDYWPLIWKAENNLVRSH